MDGNAAYPPDRQRRFRFPLCETDDVVVVAVSREDDNPSDLFNEVPLCPGRQVRAFFCSCRFSTGRGWLRGWKGNRTAGRHFVNCARFPRYSDSREPVIFRASFFLCGVFT